MNHREESPHGPVHAKKRPTYYKLLALMVLIGSVQLGCLISYINIENTLIESKNVFRNELMQHVVYREKNLKEIVKHDDLSPSRMNQSNALQEREPVCHIEPPIDVISYAVIQKIRKGIIANEQQLEKLKMIGKKPPRILCMIYTSEPSHQNIQSVVDTWGVECDGFLAASNVTDIALGALKIEHLGPEEYGNMWQKVQAMWKYVYYNHLYEYDYFHICGDDTYVMVDNLRLFLMGYQVKNKLKGRLDLFSKLAKNPGQWKEAWKRNEPVPLVLGYPINIRNAVFAGGGCGYTLNREAVSKLSMELIAKEGEFPFNLTDSREDVFVSGRLFRFGVVTTDTRDKFGAYRYVPNNPIIRTKAIWPGWIQEQLPEIRPHTEFLEDFSNETVAMHLNYDKVKGAFQNIHSNKKELIYRYDDFLKGRCDDQLLSWEMGEEELNQSVSLMRAQYTKCLTKEDRATLTSMGMNMKSWMKRLCDPGFYHRYVS